MKPKRGEVCLADLGLAAKTRPIVIISRDDPDPPRSLAIYVPLTRQNRGSRYEIPLGHLRWLDSRTVANVQGVASLPIPRFERRIGRLPHRDLVEIEQALLYACGLDSAAH